MKRNFLIMIFCLLQIVILFAGDFSELFEKYAGSVVLVSINQNIKMPGVVIANKGNKSFIVSALPDNTVCREIKVVLNNEEEYEGKIEIKDAKIILISIEKEIEKVEMSSEVKIGEEVYIIKPDEDGYEFEKGYIKKIKKDGTVVTNLKVSGIVFNNTGLVGLSYKEGKVYKFVSAVLIKEILSTNGFDIDESFYFDPGENTQDKLINNREKRSSGGLRDDGEDIK